MPTYTYKCSECEQTFEVFHSMSEECNTCEICKSQNCVSRVPTMSIQARKTPYVKKGKAGTVVRQYIEDVKKELRTEKETLKKKEHEP